jgi:hypothetical protein
MFQCYQRKENTCQRGDEDRATVVGMKEVEEETG